MGVSDHAPWASAPPLYIGSECGLHNTRGPFTKALFWSPRVQLADPVRVWLGSNPADLLLSRITSDLLPLLSV